MKREPCAHCDQAAVIRIGPPGTRGEPRCKRHLQGESFTSRLRAWLRGLLASPTCGLCGRTAIDERAATGLRWSRVNVRGEVRWTCVTCLAGRERRRGRKGWSGWSA